MYCKFSFDIYKYISITINAIASVKPKRILPGEKLGENTHCLGLWWSSGKMLCLLHK